MIDRKSRPNAVYLMAIAALSLGAPADAGGHKTDPKGEAELAKLLVGRTAGKPADCIDLHASETSQVIDHTAIVYGEGRTLWVNRPVGGLEQLDYNSVLVTRSYNSQLCSVDPVHLVDRTSHFEHGFLSLGKFVPYTKPR